MLDDLHIVDFCNDVGRIFLLLHRWFPRMQEVYIGDLIGFEEPDEYGLYSKRHESCLSTLIWLKAEGWIRFDSVVRREAVDQCVLTQLSFIHLHRPLPTALVNIANETADDPTSNGLAIPTPDRPLCLIDGLHHAAKSQDSTATHSIVMHLLVAK